MEPIPQIEVDGNYTSVGPLNDVLMVTNEGGLAAGTGYTWAMKKQQIAGLPHHMTASLRYPSLPMRISSSADGLSNDKQAYFGVSSYRTPSDTRFEQSWIDITRAKPSTVMGQSTWDYDDSATIYCHPFCNCGNTCFAAIFSDSDV